MQKAQKAFNLYKGTFLLEDEDAYWAVRLRERLRSKFLRNALKLGEYLEKSREWARAIECYQRGLEVDGLIEEFYQKLMACYNRLGRKAEAHAVYKRCRETLRSVLDTRPSPQTEAIYKALRIQEK
jgi:two-component SAPR family response regulator